MIKTLMIAALAATTPIDAGADTAGNRVQFDAETPMSAQKVNFLYRGKSFPGRLTETDTEDGTKDWDSNYVKSLKSDRRPGAIVKFKVRTCDSGGCSTRRYQDIVELDD